MATPSSFVEMQPSESLSNMENASLYSASSMVLGLEIVLSEWVMGMLELGGVNIMEDASL